MDGERMLSDEVNALETVGTKPADEKGGLAASFQFLISDSRPTAANCREAAWKI